MLFTEEVSLQLSSLDNLKIEVLNVCYWNFSIRHGSWWMSRNELPKRMLEVWNERNQVVIDASLLHRAPMGKVCVGLQNLTTFTVNYLGYAYLNCDSYLTLRLNVIRQFKFVLNVQEA